MKYIIVFVLALMIALFLMNYTIETYGLQSTDNFLGADSSVTGLLVSIMVMLVGIVFGSLYRLIHVDMSQATLGYLVKKMLSAKELWLSILVSPMVFFLVYEVTKDNPLTGSSLVLIFEQGFFCQTIFNKKIATKFESGG